MDDSFFQRKVDAALGKVAGPTSVADLSAAELARHCNSYFDLCAEVRELVRLGPTVAEILVSRWRTLEGRQRVFAAKIRTYMNNNETGIPTILLLRGGESVWVFT
jgi:hypothetical protein